MIWIIWIDKGLAEKIIAEKDLVEAVSLLLTATNIGYIRPGVGMALEIKEKLDLRGVKDSIGNKVPVIIGGPEC